MNKNKMVTVVYELIQIESDLSVPKNVRSHIKNAIIALQEENNHLNVKIDKALAELGDADEDPNIPQYTRAKIWGVVSALESK